MINLGGKPQGLFGIIISKWTVNVGRIIIVTTELILLIALIIRFVIDYQLSDLHELINKKEARLKQLELLELKYKDLQARISYAKQFTTELELNMNALSIVSKEIDTPEFNLGALKLANDSISVDANTTSVFAIDTLIKNLKKEELIESLAIAEVRSAESKLNFNLLVKLKK